MKMLIAFVFVLLSLEAFALPYDRRFRDQKLPTQKIMEYQLISNASVAGVNSILDNDAGATSAAAASQTTFDNNIDVARNIVITPSGTTADVASCVINVVGTDFHGQSINEDFTFAANQTSAVTGNKAFASISTVSYPASCEDSPFGATWRVGYGEKLGLKRCLDQAGHVVFSTSGGAYESTRPTVAVDASNVEGNTADFNGAMDGSNDFEIFFVQNFAASCMP